VVSDKGIFQPLLMLTTQFRQKFVASLASESGTEPVLIEKTQQNGSHNFRSRGNAQISRAKFLIAMLNSTFILSRMVSTAFGARPPLPYQAHDSSAGARFFPK
jgi:hypothetical protein